MIESNDNPYRIDFRMYLYPGNDILDFTAKKKDELKDIVRLVFELMRSGMTREEIVGRILAMQGRIKE